MISPSTIQDIQARIDIIDVVGEFVKLKRRGSNYLGNCPFHNEKTPSFTVSPAKEIYKCFGCGKSGNTISFIMEHEKYSYVDALKWLAKRYGIEVEETYVNDEQRQHFQTADSLYIVNGFAQKYFSEQLLDTDEGNAIGLSYFKERGFRENIIQKFELGYSPEQRDSFTQAAIRNQYSKDLLLKAGLSAERNGQTVDNYRGRVIFPIHNQSGKILGFGARILKSNEKAPKYINTPENEIYIKSKILYGIFFARNAINKENECLLVEGYTDVISLHQAGIENVVASGGTSLTTDQLRLIKKFTPNLTILYDGDAAGVKAAMRGLDMALEEGLNVKVVLIPDNEDPDSYVNKVGADTFRQFIQAAKKDVILFQLEASLKDVQNNPSKKVEIVNKVAETISKINKASDFTKQQDYIRQSSSLLQIDEAGMHALVNQFIRTRLATQERKTENDTAREQELKAMTGEASDFADNTFQLLFQDELQEKQIIRLLLEHGYKKWDDSVTIAAYILEEIEDESLFESPDIIKLLQTIRSYTQQNGAENLKSAFIYNSDVEMSTLAVSLLELPYEESRFWSQELSKSNGFQQRLFEADHNTFLRVIATGNEDELTQYLQTNADKTNELIHSSVLYFKLRKIKRMLKENLADIEVHQNEEEFAILYQTHFFLKQKETELTQELGTVIYRY